MPSKLQKIAALTSSLLLVSTFILYRGGYFEQHQSQLSNIISSSNGGAPALKKDSSSKKTDSLRRVRLSSSKSLVLTDLKLPSTSVTPKQSDSSKKVQKKKLARKKSMR